jgi:uncharacterized protein
LSLARAFVRHWLGLPAACQRVRRGEAWVKSEDGARLATLVTRPLAATPRSTVVMRTAADVRMPRSLESLAAALLAEQGHAVVMQTCRGLHSSEGRFEPFLHEARDGAALLDWVLHDAALPRPLTVLGVGYAGHAAWAAQAARADEVDALIVGFAASDPYAWLHAGGALQLDTALPLALAWAAGEPDGTGAPDPWRGVTFRPLREADRVALRRLDWWRGWLDHPERGPYWAERSAQGSAPPRNALLFGGLYDASLPALLADHARLAAGADPGRLQLRIGPWSARALPLRQRTRAAHREGTLARAVVGFLDALAAPPARSEAPVRVFVCGTGGWRDLPAWPDPAAQPHVLHLAGDGRAGGSLREEPHAEDEPPDRFACDPADATPSGGGASGLEPGPLPGDSAGERGDVLAYATEPLAAPLRLLGPARLRLFITCDTGIGDVCARLLQWDGDGTLTPLADGITRTRLPRDGDGAPVEVALSPLCHQLQAGARLLLEISGARFPRFDRHPNSDVAVARASDDDGVVARRCVFHDARRPSALSLSVSPIHTGD